MPRALHFNILSCTVHSYGMLVSVFLPTRCAVGKSIALESGRPRLESQLLPVACVTLAKLLRYLSLISQLGKLIDDTQLIGLL